MPRICVQRISADRAGTGDRRVDRVRGMVGEHGVYGIRNRQHGAAGGVLALAVFAVSSYPLQLPSFWVALVFLGAICVTKDGTQIRSSALSVSSACHIT